MLPPSSAAQASAVQPAAAPPRSLEPQDDSPPPPPPGPITELLRFRQLIGVLVVRELKVRYKGSVLGLVWTMVNPLLLMIVYTVVFSTIMPSGQKNYSLFLLSGLLPWTFFSNTVLQGLASVLTNQELIRKIRLPQAVFPLSVVGSNLVNFSLSLGPLFLLMAVLGQDYTWSLLFLPVSVLILTVFTSGLTLLLATATVFYRDVRHLAEVVIQMMFFLVPILYAPESIKPVRAWWYEAFAAELQVNPFTYLLPLVRDPIYYGQLPGLATIAVAVAAAIVSFGVGFAVFVRMESRHIHRF